MKMVYYFLKSCKCKTGNISKSLILESIILYNYLSKSRNKIYEKNCFH